MTIKKHFILVGSIMLSIVSIGARAQCLSSNDSNVTVCEMTSFVLGVDLSNSDSNAINWFSMNTNDEWLPIENVFNSDEDYNISVDSLMIHYINPGAYTFAAFSAELDNCTDTIFFDVTVNPLPAISFNTTALEYCSGIPVQIEFSADALYFVEIDILGIEIDEIDGLISSPLSLQSDSTLSLVFNPVSSGVTIVQFSIDHAIDSVTYCSASGLDTINLSILHPDVDLFALNSTFCSQDLIELEWNSTPENSDASLSGTLDFQVAETSPNSQSLLLSGITNNVTAEFTIDISAAHGESICQASSALAIEVIATPSAEVNLPQSMCSSDSLFVGQFISTQFTGTVNYSYPIGFEATNGIDNQLNDTLYFTGWPQQNGVLEIEIDLINSSCHTIITDSIAVDVLPEFVLEAPGTLCSGEEFILSLYQSGSASVTYTRVDSDEFSSDYPAVGEAYLQDAISNLTGQEITVPYEITGTNGICPTVSIEINVGVHPEPSIIVQEFGVFCDSTPIEIELLPSPDYGVVNWSRLSEETIPSSNAGSGSIFDEFAIVEQNTTVHYEISYFIQGCSESNLEIEVNITQGPTASLPDSIVFCPGDVQMLAVNAQNGIQWTPVGSVNYNFLSNPLYVGSGEEFVYVSVTNSNACVRVDSTYVSFSDLSYIDLNVPPLICENGIFNITSSNGISDFEIILSDGIQYNLIDGLISISPPYISDFDILLVDDSGCSKVFEATTNLVQVHDPSIIGTESACQNSSNLSYVLSEVLQSTTWQAENGIIVASNTNGAIVSWGAEAIGTLSFTGTNFNGCSVSGTLNVALTENSGLVNEEIIQSTFNLLEINPIYSHYQWGRLNLTTLADEYLGSGTPYIFLDNPDFNNFNYWCEYGDETCITRVYLREIELGVQEYEFNEVRIFPNPAETKITVDWSSINQFSELKFSIFKLNGDIVKVGTICNGCDVDLGDLSPSVYTIHFVDNIGALHSTLRLVKI